MLWKKLKSNNHRRNANIIRKKTSGPQVIDLTCPQGNPFNLLYTAINVASQLHVDPDPIIKDMMKGDYEHLIKVFDKHFGEYFILER